MKSLSPTQEPRPASASKTWPFSDSKKPTTMLEAALFYASNGFKVFPLPQGGKEPLPGFKWKELASDNPDQIRKFWKQYRDANIGLATGEKSRVWVLDIDSPEALEWAAPLLKSVHTLTAKTAKGIHVYFRYSPGVKNNAGKIENKVDVRGEGGYVVAPPSLHPSGMRYAWQDYAPPVEAPPELLELVKGEKPKPAPPTPAPLPIPPRPVGASLGAKESQRSAYESSALEGAERVIRNAPPGTRNDAFNRQVYALAGLGFPRDVLESRLCAAARTAGLSEQEINKTFSSSFAKGSVAPRTVELHPSEAPRVASRPGEAPTRGEPEETTPGGPRSLSAFTDTGNAERLVHLAAGEIRYCGKWGKWLVWNGSHWEEDEGDGLQRWAKQAAFSFFEDSASLVRAARQKKASEAELEAAHKSAEIWSKHARFSLGASRRAAMIELAKSEEGIPVQHTALDADPWLFNCENGTVDLRTGELRPHQKEDLLTKRSPVPYDPQSTAPTWLAFLDTIMGGDQEMIAGLQRGAGYSLTGSCREHVLFFLFGAGSNGKGTFVETLLYILGEYGYAAPSDLLLAKKHDAHPTDKASLFGRRFAACPEVKVGRWDERIVKELTGGDTISARRMREDFWTFAPTHKLWVSGNHKPQVQGTDNGIWRRLKLIPFNVTIPDAEQDKALPEKLRQEAPGILRWVVEGCLAWQRMGLAFPQAVVEATQKYRSAEDVVGRFIEECCVLKKSAQTPAAALFEAFELWITQEGERPLTKRTFGERLEERGLTQCRIGHKGSRGWQGVGLLTLLTQADARSDISGQPGFSREEHTGKHVSSRQRQQLEGAQNRLSSPPVGAIGEDDLNPGDEVDL